MERFCTRCGAQIYGHSHYIAGAGRVCEGCWKKHDTKDIMGNVIAFIVLVFIVAVITYLAIEALPPAPPKLMK